jgi:hypothetical protein
LSISAPPVDGGAVHADGLGDLGDGVLPLVVRADSFLHAAHRGGLPAVQLGLAAPGAPSGTGGFEAFACPDNQFALELLDRAENMEDQAPGRCGRIDVLLEDHQADAALVPLVGEREEVLQRRIARDRRVMTNTSPSRRQARALSSSGRSASLQHIEVTGRAPGRVLPHATVRPVQRLAQHSPDSHQCVS